MSAKQVRTLFDDFGRPCDEQKTAKWRRIFLGTFDRPVDSQIVIAQTAGGRTTRITWQRRKCDGFLPVVCVNQVGASDVRVIHHFAPHLFSKIGKQRQQHHGCDIVLFCQFDGLLDEGQNKWPIKRRVGKRKIRPACAQTRSKAELCVFGCCCLKTGA